MPRLLAERDDRIDRFERFVRESGPLLVRFLARLRVREDDVQDVAQESVARLLRYRDSEPPEAWAALLYRIAINVARDRARHERHAPTSSVETDAIAGDDSPEQHASDHEALARVRAAILRLPSRCRAVYLMHRFDGLSYPEIARRCAISTKAVEKHMSRALRELRDARERAGAAP
jgi:RNA polymerase sigma-70 factor (ECF subfamily)